MKDKFNKKYIIISKDLQKNLIEFLDEIQFDSVSDNDKDKLHKVNFCNWAINELIGSYEAYFPKETKPQKKSRDQYLDETFFDWNLPELDDEEYEKLVDQVDGFLRAWEKNYTKGDKKSKPTKERKDNPNYKSKKPYVPPFEDVAEYMSLNEIKDYLLEDEELTAEERFELYYEEHRRVEDTKSKKRAKKQMKTMLKNLGIEPFKN